MHLVYLQFKRQLNSLTLTIFLGQVENDLDTTTEKLLKANLDIEQAEKDQLAKEEEVKLAKPQPRN